MGAADASGAPRGAGGAPTEPLAPRSVFATRPDLADEVAAFARAARAEATQRALRFDWEVWRAWCRANGALELPATVDTAAAFLADQARTKAYATLARYKASITKMHKMHGHPSPMADARVQETLEGIRRRKGPSSPNAKAAFTGEVLDRAVPLMRTGHLLTQAIRDWALLLVGFGLAVRREELCSLNIEDLTWRDEGIEVLLRKSKTDQIGEGARIALPREDAHPDRCPVRALREWLDSIERLGGNAERGPVFRGLTRNGVRATRLTPSQVNIIVKRASARAGLDPANFGGHSLRAGYVTEARRIGTPWTTIMEHTGHKRLETVKRYARETTDPFKTSNVKAVYAAFAERGLSGSEARDIEALAEAFAAESVMVRPVTLPPPARGTALDVFPEGKAEHKRLCSSAAKWLEAQGRAWTLEKRHYAGGLADLAASDGSVFVEAGDTEIHKVVDALRAGQQLLLVPYGHRGVLGLLLTGRITRPRFSAEEMRSFAEKLSDVFRAP